MSLEATIAENTKALQTLIETIKASDAQRGEITAKIDTLAKAPAAAAKKAAPKAEAAAEPATTTDTRAITETPEDRKEPEVEGPSAAVLAAQKGIAEFVAAADSAESRAERTSAVKSLIDTLGSRRTPPAPAASLKSQDLTDAEATRFVDVGLPNLWKKYPAPVAEPAEVDDI